MNHRPVFVLFAAVIALAACQTAQPVGGAAASAQAVRNNVIAPSSGPGTLIAGWAGNDVLAAMDDSDRARNQQAERRAYTAAIGQQITWNNDGDAGTILPVRDGYSNAGAYCREFQQSVTLAGKRKQGYAKACQQADGSWKIAP